MEIWKYLELDEIIKDYMVSSYGNIYRISTNHMYKVKNDSENYIIINLKCKNGENKSYLLHRLIAQTFIPNPNNLPVIDHIDMNRQNNNINNLRWCTQRQNTLWAVEKVQNSRKENNEKWAKIMWG